MASTQYDRSRFDSLEDWWEWLKRQAPDQAREIDRRAAVLDPARDLGGSQVVFDLGPCGTITEDELEEYTDCQNALYILCEAGLIEDSRPPVAIASGVRVA